MKLRETTTRWMVAVMLGMPVLAAPWTRSHAVGGSVATTPQGMGMSALSSHCNAATIRAG